MPQLHIKKIYLSLLITISIITILTTIGPSEKILGKNIRIVYLHGAWVWTALLLFLLAASAGLIGFQTKRTNIHYWSQALGRTGVFFWITYLPIAMWAMQANWNGLFLIEPRFRLAIAFSISGLLLQIGVSLLNNPAWASAGNILYMAALTYSLIQVKNIMHPSSPIYQSEATLIQAFFSILLLFIVLAALQVTWLWKIHQHKNI